MSRKGMANVLLGHLRELEQKVQSDGGDGVHSDWRKKKLYIINKVMTRVQKNDRARTFLIDHGYMSKNGPIFTHKHGRGSYLTQDGVFVYIAPDYSESSSQDPSPESSSTSGDESTVVDFESAAEAAKKRSKYANNKNKRLRREAARKKRTGHTKTEPKTPEVVKPKTPEVVEPKTPEVVKPKTPEVVEPKTVSAPARPDFGPLSSPLTNPRPEITLPPTMTHSMSHSMTHSMSHFKLSPHVVEKARVTPSFPHGIVGGEPRCFNVFDESVVAARLESAIWQLQREYMNLLHNMHVSRDVASRNEAMLATTRAHPVMRTVTHTHPAVPPGFYP